MSKGQFGIIYINRSGFDYIGGNITTLLRCEIPATAMRDLEIINKEQLSSTIGTFIQANKLTPCPLVILLANSVIFARDFPDTKDPKQEAAIQSFLDHIPFNNINAKVSKLERGYRVVGTNKDIYESIINIFAKNKFTVDSVIPAFYFGTDLSAKDNLDAHFIETILRKYNTLKQESLLNIHLEQDKKENAHEDTSEEDLKTGGKKNNMRLFIMIGVFVLLLVILIAVYFISNPTTPQNTALTYPTRSPRPSATATPTFTITPTATASGSVSPVTFNQTVSIQILNGSGISGQADNLRDNLTAAGFTNIETGNAARINSSGTSVVYNNTVDTATRTVIGSTLQKAGLDIVVRETNDSEYDVIITLGVNQ